MAAEKARYDAMSQEEKAAYAQAQLAQTALAAAKDAPLTAAAAADAAAKPLPEKSILKEDKSDTPDISTDFQPAIRLMPDEAGQHGKLVGAERKPDGTWETHNEIIERLGIGTEDIDRRAFIDAKGQEMDRATAAEKSGLPTEVSPGELHSTDVNKAIEAQQQPKPAEPAAAAETPATPSQPPPKPDIDQFDDAPNPIRAFSDAHKKWVEDLEAWAEQQPKDKRIVFQTENHTYWFTKDPKGGWRYTYASNKDRIIGGHSEFKDRKGALSG